MLKIERLNWDSSFFKFEVGKLAVDEERCLEIKKVLYGQQIPFLLYVFSNRELESCLPQEKPIDEKLIFNQYLKPHLLTMQLEGGVQFYRNEVGFYDKLKELAFISGAYSRFRLDGNFPAGSYERLYKQWLDKSIQQEETMVLVSLEKKDIKGFITVELPPHQKEARIGLVAVSPDFQRQGVATQLINGAKQIAAKAGFMGLSVTTQGANTSAVLLYERNGFQLTSRTWVYHLWNK
jgi:dTDP-4-amino-4,6-dideoxy-D-galactose acyltransferase